MQDRREFLKKAAYVAPLVMTLGVRAAYAGTGYGGKCGTRGHGRGKCRPKGNNGVGNGIDPQPPGNPPLNDGPGTGPGNPGNKKGKK